MKKKLLVLAVILCTVFFPRLGFAAATQVDALIRKLVEKNILTKQEAIELKAEIASDEKMMQEEKMQQNLPEWVQNMKIKGDFRIRNQYQQKKGSETQTRARIRYRLGINTKINDTVNVGAGLASGSSDPRSTNQTLDNSFDTPDIRLDYAYAEWSPDKWINVVGGKFLRKNYLWEPSDLIWDGDINPEGGSISLKTKPVDNVELFMNSGLWILDESSTDVSDPTMWYTQPGVAIKHGKFDSKFAFTYYGFNDLRKHALDNTAGSNSLNNTGKLMYDFNSISPALEIGLSNPFDLPIQRIGLFGEFIHNWDPSDNNNGWLTGLSIGDKKVSGKGQWQSKYMYAYLGKDAILDIFPDSDRYGGKTGIRGHEVALDYGLSPNVILGFDFYRTEQIASPHRPESLLQSDLNFKF